VRSPRKKSTDYHGGEKIWDAIQEQREKKGQKGAEDRPHKRGGREKIRGTRENVGTNKSKGTPRDLPKEEKTVPGVHYQAGQLRKWGERIMCERRGGQGTNKEKKGSNIQKQSHVTKGGVERFWKEPKGNKLRKRKCPKHVAKNIQHGQNGLGCFRIEK